MEYRTLGKTGLSVSLLGFGGSPLGSVFAPITQSEADATVAAALDHGINLFDTSPWYRDSEEVLGRALQGVARTRYLLCTKLGRYRDGSPSGAFDYSAARVRRSIDESLVKLRTDCLDVVYCHDIEYAKRPEQITDETLPALQEAVAAGKVRFLGVSGLPLTIYEPVLRAFPNLDIVLSYCHYALNDSTLTALLPTFQRYGVGVVNASPLAMGLLADSPPPDWHPASPELKAACAAAAAYCRERGKSLATLALSWATRNPQIDLTLVGLARVAQVEANVAAALAAPDPELLRGVQALLAPVQGQSWPSGHERKEP